MLRKLETMATELEELVEFLSSPSPQVLPSVSFPAKEVIVRQTKFYSHLSLSVDDFDGNTCSSIAVN